MFEVRKHIPRVLVNSTKLIAARSSSAATAQSDKESDKTTAFVPVSRPVPDREIEKLQNFVDKSSRIFVLTGAGISTESGIPDYRSKDVGLYDRTTAFVPVSRPVPDREIEKLQNFVDKSSRIFVLTGAGISTESGIPDYRSKDVGLYDRVNHRPMEHSEFIKNANGRQRYWARNYIGWKRFIQHRPNTIHFSLADWERRGKAYWTVTQNVDALHTMAGTQNLTELHGCLNRVVCLDCGEISSRHELQTRLDDLNPDWTAMSYGFGPDADEFLREEDVVKFSIAPCGSCGGRLKPDVVFFGDTVRRIKVERAFSILSSCDSMLVLGSSLHVWSGFRFIIRAKELGIPVGCVNIGPTRADDKFEVKVEGKCSDILKRIVIS